MDSESKLENFDLQKFTTVPAVIIGVGGTGDAVLREIKAALLRVGRVLPPNVRLVGVDTAAAGPPINPNGESNGVNKDPLPQLQPHERVRVAGNLREISESVRGAKATYRENPHDVSAASEPHLRSWFLASEYLRFLPPPTFQLAAGAGQLRQFGRMGVFQTEGQAAKPLRRAIRDALQVVSRFLQEKQNLEVYLVSSVAGGTGAGMVVDVAHIARQVAAQVTTNQVTIRAFLFTARTFLGIQGINLPPMEARAYATMREINRFTQDMDKDYPYPMAYTAAEVRDPGCRIEDSLFDHVYYVDGHAAQNSWIGMDPKQAQFPMVAEAVLSLIDAATGDGYVQYTANVRGMKNELRNTPVASAVGAFTFALPVEAWRRAYEVRLAREVLDALVPVDKDTTRLSRLARDRRGTDGQQGKSEALPFLEKPEVERDVVVDGDTRKVVLRATGFAGEIAFVAKVYDVAVPPVDQVANRFPDTARAGFGAAEVGAVQGAGGSGVPAPLVTPRVTPAMLMDVEDDVADPSEPAGSSMPEWWPSSQDLRSRGMERRVNRFVVEQFGSVAVEAQGRGAFPAVLEYWRKYHQQKFREVLGAHVDDLLNPADDSVAARRSRLGYTQDFLEGLASELSRYERAMGEVQARRNEQGRTAGAADRFQRAQAEMLRTVDDARRFSVVVILIIAVLLGSVMGLATWAADVLTWPWAVGFGVVVGLAIGIGLSLIKGAAYTTQNAFPNAANDLLKERESDALVRAMAATAAGMRRDVNALLRATNAWADALRTATGVKSAAARLSDASVALGREREEADKSLARTFLWDERYESERYEGYVNGAGGNKVAAFLKAVRWEPVTWVGDRPELPGIRIADGERVAAPAFRIGPDGAPVVEDEAIDEVARGFQLAIAEWSGETFRGFERSVHIVDYLRQHARYRDAALFAAALLEKVSSSRLDIADGVADLSQRLTYNFLRIPNPAGVGDAGAAGAQGAGQGNAGQQAERWINGLLEELRKQRGAFDRVVRGRSADPHSCCLVFTDDFLHLERQVRAYRVAEVEYRRYADSQNNLGIDRRPLHCFAAEMNASAYEQKMATLLQEGERALDNRVVRLLEYPERVVQFLQARAIERITTRRVSATSLSTQFALRLASGGGELALTVGKAGKADLFAALTQYVCGAQSIAAAMDGAVEPIRFEEVDHAINETLRERVSGGGLQQELERREVLRGALDTYLHGEVGTLSLADDLSADRQRRDGEKDVVEVARLTKDIRAVLTMILKEEISRLIEEVAAARGATTR